MRLLAGGGAAMGLSACGELPRGEPVPRAAATRATVLGLPNERFHPVIDMKLIEAELAQAAERRARFHGVTRAADMPPYEMLAVSGGGENGAFGAGLLCGWSEQGSRPVFDWVTGVSTGALTAPFAFLGTAYDPQLREVYTGITTRDVLRPRGLIAALNDDALADNAPLFATISRYLDDRMVRDIARAYGEGRLLLIGTSDLDAQLGVIWNIGAIAASGHPRATDTIRRILLASAAIPGAFPPTMFDVTLDGRPYQELHVDGGAFAQAFLYPPSLTAQRRQRTAAGQRVVKAEAYVIRNGRLDPNWSRTERQTLGIIGRAIDTMITMSGANDVMRIYNATRADGIGFNLAYIGDDFTQVSPQPFDNPYMRSLFDFAYARARQGYPWAKKPPFGV
ncbi:patatin-like phospholipase family protein [Elioraea sp.]|uniref:patatin-like phospholipase family protein n=1 Tax=Elioraea sp. TaxID=2185103 RepID=UPI0025C5AEC9|nr:patatin-like phospholipase family protein [Elioraea sp.]